MASPALNLSDAAAEVAGQTLWSGCSLRVEPGTSVAVVGRSGSGKTTLLNCISGLHDLSAGRVEISGERMSGVSRARRRSIRRRHLGMVFQDHHLLPELTALENVALTALMAGAGRAAAVDRSRALLESVGVTRFEQVPATLSGGERQRVAVARALVNQPALVLADEPTGSLDADTRDEVLDVLLRLGESAGALVVVTHDPQVAGRASRTLTLTRAGLVGT